MSQTCPFCAIVSGDVDEYILHQTPGATAFLDRNPAVAGHTLVIPNEHVLDLTDLSTQPSQDVYSCIHELARVLPDVLDVTGISLFHTSGEITGSIEHAHVHIVPREVDDHISLALDRYELDPADARHLVSQLRTALSSS